MNGASGFWRRRRAEIRWLLDSEGGAHVRLHAWVLGAFGAAIVNVTGLATVHTELAWIGIFLTIGTHLGLLTILCRMGRLHIDRAVLQACRNDDVEVLERVAAVHGPGNLPLVAGAAGWRALHRAASSHSLGAMRWLLDAGVDAEGFACSASQWRDRPETEYWPPLWLVHSAPMAQLLIERGARTDTSPRLEGVVGPTLLHRAVRKGPAALDLVLVLLRAGAPRDLRDELGRTPVDLARELGRHDIVHLWKAFESAERAQASMAQTLTDRHTIQLL